MYSKLKKKLTLLPILRSRDFNLLSSKLPHRQECAIGYYIRLEKSPENYNQRLNAPPDFIRFIRKTAPRFEPKGYKSNFLIWPWETPSPTRKILYMHVHLVHSRSS